MAKEETMRSVIHSAILLEPDLLILALTRRVDGSWNDATNGLDTVFRVATAASNMRTALAIGMPAGRLERLERYLDNNLHNTVLLFECAASVFGISKEEQLEITLRSEPEVTP